jgi:uncharacterized membrane protein YeaQ/YmgE (transglycosylase-associated protein family)
VGLSIVGWIIIGGFAGAVAGRIAGTAERQGCLLDIVVGIIGAFLGGAILSFVGGVGVTGPNLYSFLVATFGAVVLLVVIRALR